ncbi:MAG: hypothetical protein SGJ27_00790 [Candidatus Melainabacteria bacterium]|nr:hypothetical protein [Candidatus Melainabacteria bacterium]
MNYSSNQLSTRKSKTDWDDNNLEPVSENSLGTGHNNNGDSLEQDFTHCSSSQADAGYWKHRKEVRDQLSRQSYTGLRGLTAPHLQALTQLVENYSEAIEETTSFSRANAAQQKMARAGMEVAPGQKDIYTMIVGTEDAMDATALKQRQLSLAESPTATADILAELAMSNFSEVREAVADHHLCPVSIQLMLTDDEYIEVRYALAENHNMPFQVLEKLSQDDNPYVAYRAERTMRRVLFNNVICMELPDEEDDQISAIS